MRQRFLPCTAGERHAAPARVLAPQRGLASIGPVFLMRSLMLGLCYPLGSRGTGPSSEPKAEWTLHAALLTSCIQLDTLGHEHAHSVVRVFDWLSGLKDQKAKARILHRLSQASLDHFGDCEPVGEGVSEMRIHHGPGFRVYFVRHGAAVYVLLCGGDKSSQRRDIARAKRMARELKESGR